MANKLREELDKIVTETYTKFIKSAMDKSELYLSGTLTREEFDKALEELANECNKELASRQNTI